MTPGLAFFEAGLLRSRNSISILMQCWSGLCILSTLWYIVGFSLCFGEDLGSFIGNPWDYFVMKDVAIASALVDFVLFVGKKRLTTVLFHDL